MYICAVAATDSTIEYTNWLVRKVPHVSDQPSQLELFRLWQPLSPVTAQHQVYQLKTQRRRPSRFSIHCQETRWSRKRPSCPPVPRFRFTPWAMNIMLSTRSQLLHSVYWPSFIPLANMVDRCTRSGQTAKLERSRAFWTPLARTILLLSSLALRT